MQQDGTRLFGRLVYREVLRNHLGDDVLQVKGRQLP